MNKKLILIISIVILLAIMGALYFLFRTTTSDEQSSADGYPDSVLQVINNPVEKVSENYSSIVKNDNYVISYGGNQDEGTFFITLMSEPLDEVSWEAEQDFLNTLQIDQVYACSLTVIINVPYTIDTSLSDYNFGMSFCPDRVHLSEVPRQPTENTQYYDNGVITPQTNSIR